MSIVVVGSVAYDHLETPFGKEERILGGSASHFSLTASFFHPIRLVGVVGGDFGDELIKLFKQKKIDLDGLQIDSKSKTFFWKGRYGYNLNEAETLDTQLNAFATFNPNLSEKYRSSEYLFLANIDPDLQLNVLSQMKNPKWTACDTMNLWIKQKPESLKKVISAVDILLINESEIRELTKEYNLVKAAKNIRSWGTKIIVIKRGEYGALLFAEDWVFFAPGYPLEEVKDPTGAGDTFAGGFLGYLAKNGNLRPETLKKAAIYGGVIASLNVEHFGSSRTLQLTPEEISNRFESFRKLSYFEKELD